MLQLAEYGVIHVADPDVSGLNEARIKSGLGVSAGVELSSELA